MNAFDLSIIHYLNQFAGQSWFVDNLASNIVSNELLKGGVIASILWWAWFRASESKERDREFILTAVFTSTAALLTARTLATFLPFRERPIRNPALHFHVPMGTFEMTLQGWSSFPSDHAVLFFA